MTVHKKAPLEFSKSADFIVVRLGRFELPTHGLGNRCSIQLSYKRINFILQKERGFVKRRDEIRSVRAALGAEGYGRLGKREICRLTSTFYLLSPTISRNRSFSFRREAKRRALAR